MSVKLRSKPPDNITTKFRFLDADMFEFLFSFTFYSQYLYAFVFTGVSVNSYKDEGGEFKTSHSAGVERTME